MRVRVRVERLHGLMRCVVRRGVQETTYRFRTGIRNMDTLYEILPVIVEFGGWKGGFSRVVIARDANGSASRIEFTKGFPVTISYAIPLRGSWIIEPFAGVGAYRIWQSVKIPVEGFTNDYKTEVNSLSSLSGYGTATHLSVNGSWGIVGGLNIGLAFPSL